MTELFDLIQDEEEAIYAYSQYLREITNPKEKSEILKILRDEIRHKKKLINLRNKYHYT